MSRLNSTTLEEVAAERPADNVNGTTTKQAIALRINCCRYYNLTRNLAPRPVAIFLELFDLRSDPDEMNNLAAQPRYKSKVDELKAQLFEWYKPPEIRN